MAYHLLRIISDLKQEKMKVLVFLISCGLLAYLALYPLSLLVVRSFSIPGFDGITFQNYVDFVTKPGIYKSLLNTLKLCLGTLIISILIGVPMAWGVSRTDMPLKNFIQTMVVLTFATPTFISALAWVVLLGPRAGKINLVCKALFHLENSPFNIFTMEGLMFVLALFFYPFIFFVASAALDNMDPRFEEAAEVLGASNVRIAMNILAPLILPATLAGGVLVVLQTMTVFGAPAILATPAGFYTLSTKIYSLFLFPPRFEMAAAVATPMVAMVIFFVIIQKLYLKKKQYITITGKVSYVRQINLGNWKYLLCGFCLSVIAISIFIPFATLFIDSFKKIPGFPLTIENLSFIHYKDLFAQSFIMRGIKNSLVLASGSAIVAVSIAIPIAVFVEKTDMKFRELLTFLVMVCFCFPGVALGIGLIFTFSGPPLNLYATNWMYLIGYVIMAIPLAFLYARSGLKQVGDELTESAQIHGASWLRSHIDITLPLIKNTLVAAGVMVFVLKLRELPLSIILYSGAGTEVIASLFFDFAEEGAQGLIGVLSMIILGINLLMVWVIKRIVGKMAMQI